MAEEKKNRQRGVIVEFDFTAVDGAQTLFDVARKTLAAHGVDLTIKLEALHLMGGKCQGALAELFETLDVKADAAAVAAELKEAFAAALTEQAASAVTPGFKAFVQALVAKGVKVVVVTRANAEVVQQALAGFDPELVTVYPEACTTYGCCKWDAWRRVMSANGFVDLLTVAVTGSGNGVKNALIAGASVIAVAHDHYAYQDFGGADVMAGAFDAKLADEAISMLHFE